MRFSLRTRLGVLATTLALLALVGAGLLYTFSNRQVARAAGPAHKQGVMKVTAKGKGHFATTAAVTPPGVANPEIGQSPDKDFPHSGGSHPGVSTPNPAGNTVSGSNPGFKGFNGLSHVDQRGANNGNQFSLEPPDQALCVGGGYVLESVNTALAVYSTSGQFIYKTPTTLNSFFNLPPEIIRGANPVFGPFVSDPKCYYDHATQHWFLTILEIDVDPATGAFTNHSSTLLAVSQTSSPLGAWLLYAIDTTNDGTNGTPSHPGCPCFGDQPLIGADTNGFYITTNEFSIAGSAFNGAQIYALSKSGLEAGTISSIGYVDAANALAPFGGLSYSIQPATTPSGNGSSAQGGTEFFLSALDFTATRDNRIAAWALTNTSSLNTTPNVALQVTVIGSESYGQPAPAAQKAGPRPLGTSLGEGLEKLNSNDDRMNQVMFANGLLWAGVNTALKSGHVGIAYFIVHPGFSGGTLFASIPAQGYVSVAGNNVLFPSIGVTPGGKGVIAFTLVGHDYYPSVAYASVDVANGVGDVHVAGAGAGPEDGFTGYAAYGGAGVSRWGDYSAATFDSGRVWFSAEYIPGGPRTTLANWGTFVGSVLP